MQFQHLNNIRKLILKSGILFEMLNYVIATRDEMIQSGQTYEKGAIAYNTSIKIVNCWLFQSFLESITVSAVYVQLWFWVPSIYRLCMKSMKMP